MTDNKVPPFLDRALPQKVIHVLRELKGRVLTRDFPRDVEFKQSPEDSLASASMSIIVAIHDAPDVTRRCLASLERYAPESEIILVDDASRLTETLEVIRDFSNPNGWKVVRHEKALGHSEACRAGTKFATRPFLCLLNSDTVVTPWCWRPIEEVFDHDQKIGVVGPSTNNAKNPQTLELAAQVGPYLDDNQICVFANRLLNEYPEPELTDLTWISGFAFFIRRSLWEELGGFDRKLPDYDNEVELCNRVADAGYRMVWVRNSYIHHFGEQSYRGTLGVEGIRARKRAAEMYTRQKKSSLAR